MSFSAPNVLVPEKLLPVQAAACALFDPLELYAAAIDASDYVAALAPLIRRTASEVGDLLDVGAGGGQLGAALAAPQTRFTAIEPSPTMRARLLRLPNPPAVLACGWEEAAIADVSHDTVLAATMPAVMEQAAEFLPRCRSWARRRWSGWSPRIAGRAVSALPAACRPRGTARTRPRVWTRRCAICGRPTARMRCSSSTGPSPAWLPTLRSLRAFSPGGSAGRRTTRAAHNFTHILLPRRNGATARSVWKSHGVQRFLSGGSKNGLGAFRVRGGGRGRIWAFTGSACANRGAAAGDRRHVVRLGCAAGAAGQRRIGAGAFVCHHADRPGRIHQPRRRHDPDHHPRNHRALDREVGHRPPGRQRGRLSERMDARPDLAEHSRRRDRRAGPRFPQPGAGADQRPSRRNREPVQALDRRHRPHRDRARPVVRGLRQPEHGRRHQPDHEDRPLRARLVSRCRHRALPRERTGAPASLPRGSRRGSATWRAAWRNNRGLAPS